MKKILLSFLVVFACVTLAFSQNVVITGKVTDQKDGSALPGVTVTVKGSPTIGAQTNIDGAYRLSVPANAKSLVFRFIGYKDAEASIGGDVINVQLITDSKLLNEVVVVGYGTQKRQNITGSIATVSSKEIEGTPVTSLEQAMQGKAAGVVIQADNGKLGQGIKISVRGTASISAGTQPLVVLDGVIINSTNIATTSAYTNPLADINFNDIESVDILKDASAAAIYGARASNGVLLLTTKKGKSGKSKVNFSAQFGNSKPSRHREFLNTDQYIQIERRAGVGAAYLDAAAGYYGDPDDPESLTAALDDYNSYVEGKFTTFAAGSTDWTATNTNWEKLAYQEAPQSQYDLNLSGGNEKTNYYISGQALDQKGILVGNRFKRYSGRLNINSKVYSTLDVGMNLNFASTINNRLSNDNAFSTPLQIVALPSMTPVIDPRSGLLSGSLPGAASSFPLYYNPLLSVDNSNYTQIVYRTLGNIYANWQIVKNLSFRSEFGIDQTNQNEDSYYGRLTFRNTGQNNGFGENTQATLINYTVNNFFTYKNVFAVDHTIDVTAGTTYQYQHYNGNDIQGQEFPSDAYKQISSAAVKPGGYSTQNEFSFLSYFARANYSYKSKYLLSASARYDGSSRFGTNNKYGFFPAASAGWIISQEDFLKDASTLSNLKLRVSYGLTGNAEIGNYPSLGLFTGTGSYNGAAGQRFIQLANPNLKWETTAGFDVAVEYGLFNNRLSGSVDYYRKNTRDLLLDVPIPGTLGIATQTQNLGKLYNQGIEFELSSDNLVGKFRWTTSINVAFNKTVVTDVGGQIIRDKDVPSDLNVVMEGQQVGVFYGREYAGVDPANGDALYYINTKDAAGNYDRNTTNDFNTAQNVVLGNATPNWNGGLTNNFSYSGFDLSFTFQGAFGYKIYNAGGQYMSSSAGNGFDNQTVDQMKYWDKPGDITDVPEPRMFYGNGVGASSRYLSNGTFVRLKTASLGYNIPKSWLAKVKLERAKLFVNAYNLFLITDYKGWDPEVNSDYQSTNINRSNDFYSAPQPRTITFGVNIGL